MRRYAKTEIPVWCMLPPDEHECAGGCWTIGNNFLRDFGESVCYRCEHCDASKLGITKLLAKDRNLWTEDDKQLAFEILRGLPIGPRV